ncbi:MAG: hypothetical protein HY394_05410 [Candidatus Diapherotrites archaeon]|nr:hypothetical protein [Candidatus Diapherotrites archaeon]
MARLGVFLERVFIVLLALTIFVFFYVKLRLWSTDLIFFFLKTRRWENLVYLALFVFALGFVLTRLTQNVFRKNLL